MPSHDLRIDYVPIGQVHQHPENANNGDLDALMQSIEVNGFFSPLLVQSSTCYIIAGNHRYQAAHYLAYTEVPVIWLDVTDEQAKRIMVADNRITRLGQDDEGQLFALLDSLHDTDLGLMGTGYDNSDLLKLLEGDSEPLSVTEKEPAAPIKEPVELPERDEVPKVTLSATPTTYDDDYCYEIVLSKEGFASFTRTEFNRICRSLGLPHPTDEEVEAYGVKNW